MNKFSKIFTIVSILSMTACQKMQDIGPGFTPANEGDAVKFCADGTLSCHVTFPTGVTPSVQVAYQSCIDSCEAASSTNTTAFCEGQCIQFNPDDGILGNLPEADHLNLPSEPRKAVKVTIEGCIDAEALTEVHFQGTEFRFDTSDEGPGKSTADMAINNLTGGVSNILKYLKKVSRVGRNPLCNKERKNQISVTYEPVTSSTVVYGDNSYAVVPFSSASEISQKCKMVHTTSCGVPQSILNELDLSQVAWALKAFDHAEVSLQSYADWTYVNNNIPYGDTIVMVYPMGPVPVKQGIVMYMFASAK